MKNRIVTSIAVYFILTATLIPGAVRAQAQAVFAAGLDSPERMLRTGQGNLLVAESGHGPNTGRISIVDGAGNRRTLIDGLPAGFAPPEGAPSGPSALAMRGRTVFVVIGAGDGTIAGAAPGSEIPNPNPSSPILSSVLAIHVSAKVERTTAGFSLSAADHARLAAGATVKLKNSAKDKITVRVVTNFPDSEPAPRPDQPDAVRTSNPFGAALLGKDLFVVDASMNRVMKVDTASGDASVLTSFEPVTNPLPFGPPVTDYVPDSIRVAGGSLIVTNLTGFPFPQGSASVCRVDPSTGAHETLIAGLSSAIDVLPVESSSGTQFYVLEFSQNMLSETLVPGRLLHYASATATPTVVAGDVISPVGLERDAQSGDVFVSELFTGIVKRFPPSN